MSQVGIWTGSTMHAALKLVHGGRYGSPEFDNASQVILLSLGSAAVLTWVASVFDQLTYFCEAYFCDIPVLRVWEQDTRWEKLVIPIAVTSLIGILYMTQSLIPPMASMALGELPVNVTETLLQAGELCGL